MHLEIIKDINKGHASKSWNTVRKRSKGFKESIIWSYSNILPSQTVPLQDKKSRQMGSPMQMY